MLEGERKAEIKLSEEEWNKGIEKSVMRWIKLSEQLAEELSKINQDKLGMFKLMSKEMREEIADTVGIDSEELKKYAIFHYVVGSTPDFKYTPHIDLPGDLIEKAFREKLEELKKREVNK